MSDLGTRLTADQPYKTQVVHGSRHLFVMIRLRVLTERTRIAVVGSVPRLTQKEGMMIVGMVAIIFSMVLSRSLVFV